MFEMQLITQSAESVNQKIWAIWIQSLQAEWMLSSCGSSHNFLSEMKHLTSKWKIVGWHLDQASQRDRMDLQGFYRCISWRVLLTVWNCCQTWTLIIHFNYFNYCVYDGYLVFTKEDSLNYLIYVERYTKITGTHMLHFIKGKSIHMCKWLLF